MHIQHESHNLLVKCTVAIAAVVCLGQDSLTDPIPFESGFEFIFFSFFFLLELLQPQDQSAQSALLFYP